VSSSRLLTDRLHMKSQLKEITKIESMFKAEPEEEE
jgi:hypothetical protein